MAAAKLRFSLFVFNSTSVYHEYHRSVLAHPLAAVFACDQHFPFFLSQKLNDAWRTVGCCVVSGTSPSFPLSFYRPIDPERSSAPQALFQFMVTQRFRILFGMK